MLVIEARNVNEAWDQAKHELNHHHIVRPSRVGEVWEYPEPVTTKYEFPKERVLFNPIRNCNPFFHLFESLWMLAGRQDVEWISKFNPRMKEFSDDGVIFHGAYGFRWRAAFDLDGGAEDGYADQLIKIERMLKNNHDERRAVLGMWNPLWDLERPDVKDVPCNTHIYFKVRNGYLLMTVCCRSNDIVWGAYGANAVHMSFLQEFMAAMIGVEVGPYWQISDSWHAYTERWEPFGGNNYSLTRDYYDEEVVKPYPLVNNPENFLEELWGWMAWSEAGNGAFPHFDNQFFHNVACPMLRIWTLYNRGEVAYALQNVTAIAATDWQLACRQWLQRILDKRAMKARAEAQA